MFSVCFFGLVLPPSSPIATSAPLASARCTAPVMVALKSREVRTTSSEPRSFGRKRDAAVSDEAMRWYLTSIGTRNLLDNDEEVQLASAVKELLRCVPHFRPMGWVLGRRLLAARHVRAVLALAPPSARPG